MNKHTGFLLFAAAAAFVTIGAAGCSKPPDVVASSPAASAVNVSDIDVSEHVKTALQQNDSLNAFDIAVVTLKGDVRLTGVLDNQAQIDTAIKIAKAADGAHTIHDELRIRK